MRFKIEKKVPFLSPVQKSYFRFHTKATRGCQDAPVRLKFFFGELPAELNTPLDPWKAWLSRAWMQDEVETANDLWKVAKRQTEEALTYLNDEGLFDQSKRPGVWLFFDWREGLDVNTPMQGATIFALQQTYELAKMLGREKEVSNYPALIKKMTKAVRKRFYDQKRGVMESGADKQVSILSQTWSIKAGILNKQEGAKAILKALTTEGVVMPGTPYATHYLIDAMLLCDMKQEARDYLIDYWGGLPRQLRLPCLELHARLFHPQIP